MKRACVLFISLLLVLSSCTGTSELFNQDSSVLADNTTEKLIESLKSRDSAALLALFAPSIISSNETIKENSEKLLNFIKGDIISHSQPKDNGIGVFTEKEGFQKKKEINFAFSLETTEGEYLFSIRECTFNDFDERSIGIISIDIIAADDWNNSSIFRKTETEGINFYDGDNPDDNGFYVEYHETVPLEEYHIDLQTAGAPYFESGDTVHIDKLILYFEIFQLWDIEKQDIVDRLKPYQKESSFDVSVPKSIVVSMLSERFDIKIDSENSSYQSKTDKNTLDLNPVFLDAGYVILASKGVEMTTENEETIIKFDKLRLEKTEELGDGNYNAFYSKECECEIGVSGFGTKSYKYNYYRFLSYPEWK